jgi:hypothetical protein
MNKRLYGLLSLGTLIMGMGIYLFFRNLNMVLFEWIPKPKFVGAFSVTVTPSFLSSMLLYNLPDMLWFLSGIMFLRFIWFIDYQAQSVLSCKCKSGKIKESWRDHYGKAKSNNLAGIPGKVQYG